MAALNLQVTNMTAGGVVTLESSSLASGGIGLKAFTAPSRFLRLADAKADTGVALTATATGGAMGIARTAGTSLALVGEATSASAVTDKAFWELVLPDTYNAGVAIPVDVNASIAGSGTLTAASCTITVAAYSEVNGVETALTVTPSTGQQMAAGGSDLLASVAGTGLVPGSHVGLEVVMLITSSSGANTGHVNSVSYSA